MSKDDAQELAELAKDLPAIDLDTTSATRMAHRVREDLGKGAPPRRLVLPIAAAITVIAYLVWTVFSLVRLLA